MAGTPDPLLLRAAEAAQAAYHSARGAYGRQALAEIVAEGADGTPTMRIDTLVEAAILRELDGAGVNVLSEESGWTDTGASRTLVMDPLDGSANAAAGVPLTAFAAAMSTDGQFTEALTMWLDTGRIWWAGPGGEPGRSTSGRRELDGAAVSLLRPHPGKDPERAWWAVARRAARIRILSTSCLEAALVADGATDAFADAGTDTHRLVDLAAAVVTVTAAGGWVGDVWDRPLVFDPDLTRRWSGVVAATPELGAELAAAVRGALPTPVTCAVPSTSLTHKAFLPERS
jgi:myo-inositol-1(or 4)-monophosphatase